MFPMRPAADDAAAAAAEPARKNDWVQEEWRLAYVALTRCHSLAAITFASRRLWSGQWRTQTPSSFLKVLPSDNVHSLAPNRARPYYRGLSGFKASMRTMFEKRAKRRPPDWKENLEAAVGVGWTDRAAREVQWEPGRIRADDRPAIVDVTPSPAVSAAAARPPASPTSPRPSAPFAAPPPVSRPPSPCPPPRPRRRRLRLRRRAVCAAAGASRRRPGDQLARWAGGGRARLACPTARRKPGGSDEAAAAPRWTTARVCLGRERRHGRRHSLDSSLDGPRRRRGGGGRQEGHRVCMAARRRRGGAAGAAAAAAAHVGGRGRVSRRRDRVRLAPGHRQPQRARLWREPPRPPVGGGAPAAAGPPPPRGRRRGLRRLRV